MWASVAVGLVATFMAWKMQDIIDVLLLGFTISSAALFVPTMAALLMKRTDSNAAFWSIALSLPTVILWEIAASSGLEGVFTTEPLWPGLAVSAVAYLVISMAGRDGHHPMPFPRKRGIS
jgi:SSS family solute:Na+ symporter